MNARWLVSLGAGLSGLILVAMTVGLSFDLQGEEYEAIWEIGLVVAGAGLAATLAGLAWRLRVAGIGTILIGVGLAAGLADWLVDRPLWTVEELALLCVGAPLQVRTIAKRTGFFSAAGVFGAAGMGAAGVALTSRLARDASVSVTVGVFLDIAMVLGLLAAALCAGMALATKPAHLPSEARPKVEMAPDSPLSVNRRETIATAGEDDAASRTRASAEPLNRYQRLTLAMALIGAVAGALISVAGSIITAMITG
ncbi:hypothetical protein ACIHFD_31480 [Nonomuraea sp. NPDC051941]|uniref:hypothetical protein n=1 Tax=Nonomuraea sp. NPDC051941 TaxID=3364373 RepID=UPI0037C7C049